MVKKGAYSPGYLCQGLRTLREYVVIQQSARKGWCAAAHTFPNSVKVAESLIKLKIRMSWNFALNFEDLFIPTVLKIVL